MVHEKRIKPFEFFGGYGIGDVRRGKVANNGILEERCLQMNIFIKNNDLIVEKQQCIWQWRARHRLSTALLLHFDWS